MKAQERSQHFSHYKYMGIFHGTQGELTPQLVVWQNFKPIQDFIVVLVTCNNEEDPIKNKDARVVTTLFIDFSDAQKQVTPRSVMESC